MDILQDFVCCGFRCIIARMTKGHLCGYVAIPAGHPLHGHFYSGEYNEQDEYMPSPVEKLTVHGGITYADSYLGDLEKDGTWWLGFDCAHRQDFTYFHPYDLLGMPNKNERFVRLELKDLTEQLSKM